MKDKILCTHPYYHSMRKCMAADYIRVKGDYTVTTLKCKSKPVSVIREMEKTADVIWGFPKEKLEIYTKYKTIYDNILVSEKDGFYMYIGESK